MKKQFISIAILACFCTLCMACGSNNNKAATVIVRNETASPSPITTPVLSEKPATSGPNSKQWYGVGIYNRCIMTTVNKNGLVTANITWGNSATSSYQYTFSGALKDNILTYDNLVEKEVVVDEQNRVTEKELNNKLSGQIFFYNNIALWNNSGSTVVLATEDAYVEDASKLNYTGKYHGFGLYERVSMEITQKDHQIQATLSWSDSASEKMEYSFSGTIAGSQVNLTNIVTKKVTYKKDGTKKEKVESKNGTGTIYLSDGFITIMNDEADFVIPLVK